MLPNLVPRAFPLKREKGKALGTSPNEGIPNQVPWLGLVSLFQIWDFCGYCLNTLKYPKMGICYFFPCERLEQSRRGLRSLVRATLPLESLGSFIKVLCSQLTRLVGQCIEKLFRNRYWVTALSWTETFGRVKSLPDMVTLRLWEVPETWTSCQ